MHTKHPSAMLHTIFITIHTIFIGVSPQICGFVDRPSTVSWTNKKRSLQTWGCTDTFLSFFFLFSIFFLTRFLHFLFKNIRKKYRGIEETAVCVKHFTRVSCPRTPFLTAGTRKLLALAFSDTLKNYKNDYKTNVSLRKSCRTRSVTIVISSRFFSLLFFFAFYFLFFFFFFLFFWVCVNYFNLIPRLLNINYFWLGNYVKI